MKVIITEFQFKNLLLNNKKTIRISESQYERLLSNKLVEQSMGGQSMSPGKYTYSGPANPNALTTQDISDWWKKVQKIHVPTEVERFLGFLDKNVGRPISHWADDVVKYDIPYIKRELDIAFGEDIGEGFGMFWDYVTETADFSSIGDGFKEMWKILSDPKSYSDVLDGFGKLGEFWVETVGDLYDWFATWTWKDWVDLAAIILYCIPTPLTWAIATGLEVVNIGDSLIKGELSDAGWRALGLIGGALLSKAIGGSYKVSQKTIDEVSKITTNATKIYGKGGPGAQKAYTKYINDAIKAADGETEAFFRKLTAYQSSKAVPQSVADNMAKIQKEVERILDAQSRGVQKYAGWTEQKIIQNATESVVGKGTWINRIINHTAPVSKFERRIFMVVYGGAKSVEFMGYLRELGLNEKQCKALLDTFATINGGLSSEEQKKQYKISQYNLKHKVMAKKNPFAVTLGNKLGKNCSSETNKFKWKVIEPGSESWDNIVENGEEIPGGGDWKYVVVMNDEVPFDESGVYVQKETFSEGTENPWKAGNCDTSYIMLRKWCKVNNPDRRSEVDYYSACVRLFDGGDSIEQQASKWLFATEKINDVKDIVKNNKEFRQNVEEDIIKTANEHGFYDFGDW